MSNSEEFKVLDTASVSTLSDLQRALEVFWGTLAAKGCTGKDIIGLEGSQGGDSFSMKLIESTLTDGSKVYDISIIEDE